MNIQELAKRRAEAALEVENLAMMNLAVEYEARLKQDITYRLAKDALAKAESDYHQAIANLSFAELSALAAA